MDSEPGQVTQLLQRLNAGERDAMPRLVDLVYSELHRIARLRMHSENAGHTLTPTALVHEAYVRLAQAEDLKLANRSHFFAVAARAMRRILVDHARAREAARRGGGNAPHISADDLTIAAPEPDHQIILLDNALKRLAELSPRQCQVVELRHFVGFQDDEVAAVLNVTTRTVSRDWRHARAWLQTQLRTNVGPP